MSRVIHPLMSQEDVDALLSQATSSYLKAAEDLKKAADLKGIELTDDDLANVAGGSNTVCATCVATTPICSPGSLIASLGS